MRAYLPWLGAPLTALALGLWLSPGGDGGEEEKGLPVDVLTGEDRGRSALKFHALARDGLDETPLHEVNEPGLAIDLEMDPDTYAHMQIRGVRALYKRRRLNVAVGFADLKPAPAVLRLRGASSLRRGDRVNFGIGLLRPVMITPEIEMDDFYLVNMFSDPEQFRLEFAYRLLGSLGLFPAHHQYARVLVNGESQGMFLLVERPRDGIRRANEGVVSVSRRARGNLFKTQWSKKVPYVQDRIARLKEVMRGEAEEPVAELEEILDLEAYLTWMATNSLLRNADTIDEIFFFEMREEKRVPGRLHLMAWDYDETLQPEPPKRLEADDLMYVRKLTALDDLIRADPELARRYRETLARLLEGRFALEPLLALLGEVHALRDSLDDGLPAERQQAERLARARGVERFAAALRERHAWLRGELGL